MDYSTGYILVSFCVDDSSEIGEETCFDRSRWSKRRRDKQKSSDTRGGWIKRRGGKGRRLGSLPHFAPVEMSDIPLLLETKQSKLLDFFGGKISKDEDGEETDSDATVEYNCDENDDDDDDDNGGNVSIALKGANQIIIIFRGGWGLMQKIQAKLLY